MADDAADGSEGNTFPMHLRTVHSALVIACLAILVAATSYHERALDTAVDDVDRITGLFPVVADGQWLRREADRLLATRPPLVAIKKTWRLDIPLPLLPAATRKITNGKPLVVQLQIDETVPYTIVRGDRSDSIRVGLLPDPLRQFGDWSRMWDEMHSVQICAPRIASAQAWFITGQPATLLTLPLHDWQPDDASAFYRTQRLELQYVGALLSQPLRSSDSIAVVSPNVRFAFTGTAKERAVAARVTMEGQDLSQLLYGQEEIPKVMVPVVCDLFDLRAQSILAERANKEWSPGTYEQSFPDLAALTEGLKALQPDQVGKVLRNLRERTGKEVEVFGLKIPLEVITRWGLIIVLAIQFYFWVDLRNFLEKSITRSMLEVPWIGLYRDRLSRAAFWLSATALPAGTVIFLTAKGITAVEGASHRFLFALLTICGALASIILATLTARAIQKLAATQATFA